VALARDIMALLKKKGVSDRIALAVGGVIPKRDFAPLNELGVAGAFQPHTLANTVIDFVNNYVAKADKKAG
jgi:methylmalonyl-CoA mutase cobalamin-binding domain/chain